jgi:hypothetical protein
VSGTLPGCTAGAWRFLVADANKFVVSSVEQFDFILVNSFLHQLGDSTAKSILANLAKLLTDATPFCLQMISPFHKSEILVP